MGISSLLLSADMDLTCLSAPDHVLLHNEALSKSTPFAGLAVKGD
jgi:hypothetical protein